METGVENDSSLDLPLKTYLSLCKCTVYAHLLEYIGTFTIIIRTFFDPICINIDCGGYLSVVIMCMFICIFINNPI